MSIKEEIEGNSGYLKKVREMYMPDTKTMANLAFERVVKKSKVPLDKDYVLSNADQLLQDLFVAETEIFKEKNNYIIQQVIPYSYSDIYMKNDESYPITYDNIKRILDIYAGVKENTLSPQEFVEEISNITVPIIDAVSFSQKQSAKARVGESLQNHLARLFDICGYEYSTQQQKTEGGTIMDFVIPNVEAVEKMPDQVINIECQTTLKDRFRLTTGKSTDAKIKRYLATVTGLGLLTKRDKQDLSVEKVKEIILDNNVTLVVFEEVKEDIKGKLIKKRVEISKGKSKDSVTEEEIEKLIKLSDHKIISFKDLIKRDIPSTLLYWKD